MKCIQGSKYSSALTVLPSTETHPFGMKIIVTKNKSKLTNQACLFKIGEFFKSSGFRTAIDRVSKVRP